MNEAPEKEEQRPMKVWQIFFMVIAGLMALLKVLTFFS